jgi:transmembrane 9 superfamily protein 2/4
VAESLGSILFGDRIFTSPFELAMKKNEPCKSVCSDGAPTKFSGNDAILVNKRISMAYLYNWLVDGLPAGIRTEDLTTGEEFTTPGFPLGSIDLQNGKTLLHNHYDITIEYHEAGPSDFRVVGFHVEPSSRADNGVNSGVAYCGNVGNGLWLDEKKDDQAIHWTYSVNWTPSEMSFATRWDKYLHVYDPKIHWFWLINSAVIVCLLVGMVSTILLRTLRKDIARYNRLDEVALEDFSGTGIMDDGVQEDSGWKLVHGDVFRPPTYPLPLSILVGNGAQLFMMTGFTIGTLPVISLNLNN